MKYFVVLLMFLGLITSSSAQMVQKISLRDKIGQMLIIGFEEQEVNAKSALVKSLEKNNLGGLILFDYNYRTGSFNKNIVNPIQVKELNQNLQYFNHLANVKYHRPDLPLFISVDYEGGKINRLSEHYGFPKIASATEIGKKGLKNAKQTAKLMAETLKKEGFNLNFAPVLDLNLNSANPIIAKKNRSFSDKPEKVTAFAKIYSDQFLNQNIECAYKHFPGHGSAKEDSHLGFVDVSTSWQSKELSPYKNLFKKQKSCGLVMTAHIVNRQLDASGLPATLSKPILTNLLRQQLHFKGVVITDDMQMKAISQHYGLEEALVLAINAGADMFIFGNNLTSEPQDPEQIINIIEEKVHSGAISEERIEQAYQRIVKLKKTMLTISFHTNSPSFRV